jgi:hypothetical protein
MNSTKKNMTKKVVRFVAGYCAMSVAGNVIANNTNPQTTSDKVVQTVGVVAIGATVSYAVGNYTDQLIDELWA